MEGETLKNTVFVELLLADAVEKLRGTFAVVILGSDKKKGRRI